MEYLDIKKRVSKKVTHQDIGGKEIRLEFEIKDHAEVLEKACFERNPACINFMNRRPDFKHKFPYKIYYGKVGALGYVVAEDELEDL